MKIKVYQSKDNSYVEMISLGKLKYIGESFGLDSLTNGKIYDFVDIYPNDDLIKIVDDSEEDYMYQISNPKPLDGSSKGGKWEIVEIYNDEIRKTISKQIRCEYEI